MKKLFRLLFLLAVVFAGFRLFGERDSLEVGSSLVGNIFQADEGVLEQNLHPLAIESLRQREYPGSKLTIEKTLSPGSNYQRYVASYKSEGFKIFGLLTIPNGIPPNSAGWPAVVFNHGFIQPSQYVTTEKYVAYVDGFARNGYVVFKSDYRGHGNSEGTADGNYYSPGYVVDVLNAVASVKKMDEVDGERIGMWGHSMGGNITMKNLVISDDIKVAVIWAGVVGSYEDILNNWNRARSWRQSAEHKHQGPSRQTFLDKYGVYDENSEFWKSIDPYLFLEDIEARVQLHHGTGDTHVPILFSENFKTILELKNKEVELYSYEGADHNLSGNAFSLAMQRSVQFFDRYLK